MPQPAPLGTPWSLGPSAAHDATALAAAARASLVGTARFMTFEPLAGRRRVKVADRRTKADFAHVIRELVDEQYPTRGPAEIRVDPATGARYTRRTRAREQRGEGRPWRTTRPSWSSRPST